ncbi:MAG: penicillin-binding protein 2 [Lachnospiraceae bacterium]|jgi:peptidoglycan glycosyltransferase|nr:penicillin-binding protein 2 [Lachnospiraceae bacterium]MCI1657781.1 penicillin-binding protein 2 [Lachnospiraceae bacterium]MCI2196254.1 penicillin-binding protein 2 [Lachnospiraceae bacterium]
MDQTTTSRRAAAEENRRRGIRYPDSPEGNPENLRRNGGRKFEFHLINVFFILLFLALIAYFIFFLVVRSESVISNSHNTRMNLYAERVLRGSILTADGKTIAESKTDEKGKETRSYPSGRMFAHVAGYTNNGKSGIESKYNFSLLRSHTFFLKQIYNDLLGKKSQGDSVVTTLNYKVQKAAYQALGDRKGAVVVLDVKTGKVLSMVSKPDFDPETLAAKWKKVTSDGSSSVLLNRASNGLYPPGSTFKILTALEYIHEHKNYKDYSHHCTGSVTKGKTTIHCYGNTAHGTVNLQKAFEKSCNTAFSTIGLDLNIKKYRTLADRMMFNQPLPTNLFSAASSRFTLEKKQGTAKIMTTAIGQGDTLVSPLHMAMIAAAIDHNGVVMKPYAVDRVKNDTGLTVSSWSPETYGSIMDPSDAAVLKKFMRGVVTEGTARAMADDSYQAYGKTGSAEYNEKGDSHGWFVGFARKKGKRDIAIAVIVENGGSGSSSAVPVAEKVFDTYFA